MTAFENNPSPYLTIDETAVPANPAAGNQRLFIDPVDHLLKSVDSAGDVTVQGGGVVDLASLSDVNLAGLADGDVLVWDTTTSLWIVAAGGGGASTLAALTDVDLTGLADGDMLVWDTATSTWIVASAGAGGTAAGTTFTPAGSIAATDVQAALQELDTEKAATSALPSAATTAAQGIVELATNTEATTGTDTVRAVTPAGLKAATDALYALILNAPPSTLDTLDEIAAALGDDPNFAATMTTALGLKAPAASPTLTGTVTIPTVAGSADSSQKAASTAFVQAVVAAIVIAATTSAAGIVELATSPETATGTDTVRAVTPKGLADLLASFALLASPAFSGNPTVPTQAAGTNSTRAASTAYADGAVAKQSEVLIFALSDETTAITAGLKVTVRMPFAMTLTSVRASLTTASTGAAPAVNIKESGTTIFSTTLTIDANETTSQTAAVPAVISDGALADDAEITFIVDTAGTGAKGLKVQLIGTRT